MSQLPALITDLALIMIVAGITTLLFKKLNQPLVLGYIVAGVLVGPVTAFMPTVSDMENVETLADIGVIFLMFGLGLEFSLHKLAKVGKTAFITAVTTITFMLFLGFAIGEMLGWGKMNSIFLGGMICMSSTIIIIKALEDLNLKKEPFAEGILGVLVLEDVAAIFLMVVLSTISVSQGSSGAALLGTLGKMALYLALWLFLGIYMLPTFFKRIKSVMNDETLLVVSVGICFGMVWLAETIGFSSALGAFLAGSILAGTVHAERIDRLINPCKDLFAAVFFVSVGMMVSPSMLVQHFVPIMVITAAVMLGQMASVAGGMLLSGKDFSTAVKGGSAMCQIGEFSFIIASLGVSLNVTDDFLYPVVVAVSVITTFATPYWVRSAPALERMLRKVFPGGLLNAIDSPAKENSGKRKKDPDWEAFRKRYIREFAIYGTIVLGVTFVFTQVALYLIADTLHNFGIVKVLMGIIALVLVSPFVRPMITTRNRFFTALFLKDVKNRWKLGLLSILRIAFCGFCLSFPLELIFPMPSLAAFFGGLLLSALLGHSDWLDGIYFAIETRFLANFNERKLQELVDDGRSPMQKWMDENLFVEQFLCHGGSSAEGVLFSELKWSTQLHVNVIKIRRDEEHFNIPDGGSFLLPGDRVFVMGEKKQLENFIAVSSQKNQLHHRPLGMEPVSIFLQKEEDMFTKENRLICRAVKVEGRSKFVGKSVTDSGIKAQWHCALAGIERDNYPLPHPNPKRILMAGDLLWLLGSEKQLDLIQSENLMTASDKADLDAQHLRRLRKITSDERKRKMRKV